MDDQTLAAFMDAARDAHADAAARTGTIDTEIALGPARATVRACGTPLHERLTEMLVLPSGQAPRDGARAEILAFDTATSVVSESVPLARSTVASWAAT